MITDPHSVYNWLRDRRAMLAARLASLGLFASPALRSSYRDRLALLDAALARVSAARGRPGFARPPAAQIRRL